MRESSCQHNALAWRYGVRQLLVGIACLAAPGIFQEIHEGDAGMNIGENRDLVPEAALDHGEFLRRGGALSTSLRGLSFKPTSERSINRHEL